MFLIPTSQISEATSEIQPITLDWSYFQESNENFLEYDAFLSYGTQREWTWEKMDSKKCYFQITSLKSNTIIFSEKSWVKEDKKSDELLNHEQRHLDINEIFNQKANNEFQKIMFEEFQCSENASERDIENQVNRIVIEFFDSFEKEHHEFQDKYDHEVDHGLNKEMQKKWDQTIECMLKNYQNNYLCEYNKV